MQLTWPKNRSTQPKAMVSEQTDDPFHLEPLSIQASVHVRDGINSSRPYKRRRFRFVAEQAPDRKQTSSESCGARTKHSSAYLDEVQELAPTQQSNIFAERTVYECTTGSPELDTLEGGIHGKTKHAILVLIVLIFFETIERLAQASMMNKAEFLTYFQRYFRSNFSQIPLICGRRPLLVL